MGEICSALKFFTNNFHRLFPYLIYNNEPIDKLSEPRKHMQSLLETHSEPHADLHSFRHTFFNQNLLKLRMEIEERRSC